MRILLALAALMMVTGGISKAAAQHPDEQQQRATPATIVAPPVALAIASFDRDSDMLVTRQEYQEGVERSFERGDSDHDGFIGLIELSAWAATTLGNANALPGPFDFDRDGDDRISHAEFVAEFVRRWAKLDTNKDDRLARSELVSLVAIPMGDRPMRRGGQRMMGPDGETRPPR
jgi:Ca2+-binding EF-hand superfamily protein